MKIRAKTTETTCLKDFLTQNGYVLILTFERRRKQYILVAQKGSSGWDTTYYDIYWIKKKGLFVFVGQMKVYPISHVILHNENSDAVGRMKGRYRLKSLYVADLEVEQNYRRRGWGRFFMNFAKCLSLLMGKPIELLSLTDPEPFYKKCGFAKIEDKRRIFSGDHQWKRKLHSKPFKTRQKSLENFLNEP